VPRAIHQASVTPLLSPTIIRPSSLARPEVLPRAPAYARPHRRRRGAGRCPGPRPARRRRTAQSHARGGAPVREVPGRSRARSRRARGRPVRGRRATCSSTAEDAYQSLEHSALVFVALFTARVLQAAGDALEPVIDHANIEERIG